MHAQLSPQSREFSESLFQSLEFFFFFFFFRVLPFDYVPTVAGLASNTNLCLLTLVRPLNQGWSSIPGGQAWKLTPTSKLVQSQLLSVITIHCLLSNGTKVLFHNFLGSTVVKNLPANAGGHWFDPWEDSTFHGATEPMSHNYWAHVLQLLKPEPRDYILQPEEPLQWEICAQQKRLALACDPPEEVQWQQWRLSTNINK